MKQLAVLTQIFNYPKSYMPAFYDNALKYFNKEDIHIIRENEGETTNKSIDDLLFLFKVIKIKEYIQNNLLGKYEHVLYMDATDTNFIKNPSDIVFEFNKHNKSIIFGGEMVLYPHTENDYLYDYKPKETEFIYLNAGVWIGKVEKVIQHMQQMIDNIDCIYEDQGRWTYQYLHNDDIMIDQHNHFFFNTYNAADYISITKTGVTLKNMSPYVIHDNGPKSGNTFKICEFYNNKKSNKTLM